MAIQLQQAMLTDLPAISGPELSALYRPAAAGELVGGDWYDAYPLGPAARAPLPASGAGRESVLPLALTVGDITGHDMRRPRSWDKSAACFARLTLTTPIAARLRP